MRRVAVLFVLTALAFMLAIVPALCLDTDLKVYDDAGLFTASELDRLRDRAEELVSAKNIDVVIVTTDDADGKSSMAYADDYYDFNGFGIGSDNSGLLLLIDRDNRVVWISTTGKCIDYFKDARIDEILDHITGYLIDGKYGKAADLFLDEVEGTPITPLERSLSHALVFVLVAIGISGIVVGIMSINNKGKKTTNAGTYLEKDSFFLRDNRDIYIRTAVTKRRIESSGGGSSTHKGSSGVSHGGGGRSF